MAAKRLDVLALARAVNTWTPVVAETTELTVGDRVALAGSLADHLVEQLELGDGDLADEFRSVAASPYLSSVDDADEPVEATS